MCPVFVHVCDVVEVYICDCNGGMCLLRWWLVVLLVHVGPCTQCTCVHGLKLVLLIWHAQATLHQMSCDRGRGYVPWEACGRRYMYIFPCHEYHYKLEGNPGGRI